jgi:hypothetical protein
MNVVGGSEDVDEVKDELGIESGDEIGEDNGDEGRGNSKISTTFDNTLPFFPPAKKSLF